MGHAQEITWGKGASGQLVNWLKREADIVIGENLLDREAPPKGIPTSTLARLHDGLSQH